jgi:3-oxoacyl-[acyl-carrier protein] reductase
MRLKNKVAIITGAASGIGRQTAVTFAREGARVVLADRMSGALLAVENELKANSYELMSFHIDIVDRDSISNMVCKVIKDWNKIDILVNNAGITADAQMIDMKEEDFDSVIDVNLKGVYNCSQIVARQMKVTGGGVILNASSVVGLYGNFGQTNYAASKWGVIGMTKTWAKELGKNGIRVNAVAPGFIKTPMTDTIPGKLLEHLIERSTLKRIGIPEDVANAYLFLASDEANYITGTVLSVDGGVVL